MPVGQPGGWGDSMSPPLYLRLRRVRFLRLRFLRERFLRSLRFLRVMLRWAILYLYMRFFTAIQSADCYTHLELPDPKLGLQSLLDHYKNALAPLQLLVAWDLC